MISQRMSSFFIRRARNSHSVCVLDSPERLSVPSSMVAFIATLLYVVLLGKPEFRSSSGDGGRLLKRQWIPACAGMTDKSNILVALFYTAPRDRRVKRLACLSRQPSHRSRWNPNNAASG